MDLEYVSKLCEPLSIEEEENSVVLLSDEQYIQKVARMNRCLVGKITCSKSVNRDAFKGVILLVWRLLRDGAVESLG